jgi:hypothetical protein
VDVADSGKSFADAADVETADFGTTFSMLFRD